ncbi:MAG: PAS domain-containing protein [Ruminococcaceae bacterium]|jgi:adenylate cyclase|nr:PAS domain-containing protein [Oscillospiraceae bacterium]
MSDKQELIRESIMRDMSEGVMTIGFDGTITYVNPSALGILSRSGDELLDHSFGACFFDYEENDAFTQAVLDAVYDQTRPHEAIVPYFTGTQTKQLRMVTSFLTDGEQKAGVIVVLSDMTELAELRDAVKAMERIRALNDQLELRNKLLNETFGRFLSDEIVRQLLETPDGLALGGKKRTLTILMSDLRGFTAMSERMDAADLISMLNHYLGEMTEVIQSYNGTIIEFIGDGILAIFGAPTPSDTHAADAVAAAVAMEARMEAVNAWNAERDYPVLEMGIGVNTGEVIVGNIGSEKRTKYGVVGSHVNLCGRIESYTVGGQVLIAPLTREKCGAALTVAQEMTVYPKGVKGELVLSQVTGIGEPYNVTAKVRDTKPQALERPVPVRFHKLDGKHGGARSYYGGILAVAHDGAVLDTATELEIYDNIQLEAGGKLFCKVMEKRDDGCALIRYTSIPAGYEAWLKAETNKKTEA